MLRYYWYEEKIHARLVHAEIKIRSMWRMKVSELMNLSWMKLLFSSIQAARNGNLVQ